MFANQPRMPSISTPSMRAGVGGRGVGAAGASIAGTPRANSRIRSRTELRRATMGTPGSKSLMDDAGRDSTVLAPILPGPIKFEGSYQSSFRNLLCQLGIGREISQG